MGSASLESRVQKLENELADARYLAKIRTLVQRFLTKGGNGTETPVTATATDVDVTLPLVEADAGYAVVATPNWDTTCFVTDKTTTGFTINFGTAAPASAVVDWSVIRTR